LVLATVACGSATTASELTRGKKALFAEDLEMDVYEWVPLEEGENEDENPELLRTDEAYERDNALLISARKGIPGLGFTDRIKCLLEFQVKSPAPHGGHEQLKIERR